MAASKPSPSTSKSSSSESPEFDSSETGWPAFGKREDSSAFFIPFLASTGHSLGVPKFAFSCATRLAVLALRLTVASSVALRLGADHVNTARLKALDGIRTSLGRHHDL